MKNNKMFLVCVSRVRIDNINAVYSSHVNVLGVYRYKNDAVKRMDDAILNWVEGASSRFGYRTIEFSFLDDSVKHFYKIMELLCQDTYLIKEIEIDEGLA